MGNVLAELKRAQGKLDLQIANMTFSRLRESYATFKSICDSYSIDATQFSQIFNCSHEEFQLFDTDHNGLVDAIELFTGAILLSECSFEDKVKFLFDFFDFNEELRLGFDVLEFLFLSALTATKKLFLLAVEEARIQEQINELLDNHYYSKSTLTQDQFLQWCARLTEVTTFFALLKKDLPIVAPRNYHYLLPPFLLAPSPPSPPPASLSLPLVDLLASYSEKNLPQRKAPVAETEFHAEWSFGINIEGVRQPLQVVNRSDEKASLQKLIYLSGSNAVVYFPKLNQQKLYRQHERQLQALCLARNHSLVATGESGDYPEIHVWDYVRLHTVSIIKGHLRRGVQLLSFFLGDQFLAAAGAGSQHSLFLYNVKEKTLLMSVALQSQPVQILVVLEERLTKSEVVDSSSASHSRRQVEQSRSSGDEPVFLVVERQSIALFRFRVERSAFLMNEVVNLVEATDPIVSASFFHDTFLVIVSVQASGKVARWGEDFTLRKSVSVAEARQVRAFQALVLLLCVDRIRILDQDLSMLSTVELSSFRPLISLRFQFMQPVHQGLLLLSEMGDVLELRVDGLLSFQFKRKLFALARLEQLQGAFLLNPELLVAYSQLGLVYYFELRDRELLGVASIQPDLRLLVGYSVGPIFYCCAAVPSGLLFQRRTIERLEEQKFIPVSGTIVDLKFSGDQSHLVALTREGEIHQFYSLVNSHWKGKDTTRQILDDELVSFSFSEDSKSLVVFGQRLSVWKVILPELKFRNVSNALEQVQIPRLRVRLPHLGHPFVFLSQELSLLCCKSRGVYYWSGPIAKDSFEGVKKELAEDIVVDKGRAFFVSKSSILCCKVRGHPGEDRSLPRLGSLPPVFQAELAACSCSQTSSQKFKDCFVQVSGCTSVEGFSERSHHFMSIPNNGADTGSVRLRVPPLRLQLQQVLGYDCSRWRRTLFYAHYYTGVVKPAKAQRGEKRVEKASLLKEMLFPKQKLLPYDQEHEGCSKLIIFKAGRLAVIMDQKKRQKFYQGHRNQISCMAVHPQRNLVATGERAEQPLVHLWQLNGSCVSVVKTIHSRGIKQLAFSREGSQLVSVGADQSIQVADLSTGLITASRYKCCDEIFDIVFNPYDCNEFASGGLGGVALWRVEGRNVYRKQQVYCRPSSLVTALVFINYSFGAEIESDLISGSSEGELGIISYGHMISVHQQAHQGAVNCLKVTELFSYKIVILSAGEDEVLRLWDTKFNLVSKVELRRCGLFFDHPVDQSLAPQSLDIYLCKAKRGELKEEAGDSPVILLGTRSGHIVEVTLSMQFRGLKEVQFRSPEADKQDELYNQSQSILFSFALHSKFHASVPKLRRQQLLFCALHQAAGAVLTVGVDRVLFVIHCGSGKEIFSTRLDFEPSSLLLIPTLDLVLIGCAAGQIIVYELQLKELPSIQRLEILGDKEGKGVFPALLRVDPKGALLGVAFNPRVRSDEKQAHFPELVFYALANDGRKRKVDRPFFSIHQHELSVGEELSELNVASATIRSFSFCVGKPLVLLCLSVQETSGSSQFIFQTFNYERGQAVLGFEGSEHWQELNFADCLNAKYFGYEELVVHRQANRQAQPYAPTCRVKPTVAVTFAGFIIQGTSAGEVIISRPDAAFLKAESALARLYACHSHSVNALLFYENLLFTAADQEESLLKWSIEQDKEHWDINYIEHEGRTSDFEVGRDQFERLKNLVVPLRSVCQPGDQSRESRFELQLKNVAGRSAWNKRSNIFYDQEEKIVYAWGCKLIVGDYRGGRNDQEIVSFRDGEVNHMEISCLTLSPSRMQCAVCTVEEHCRVFVLDYNSLTCLKDFALKGCVMVLQAKIAADHCHFVCLALTAYFERLILLVDLARLETLSLTSYSKAVPERVRELLFTGNGSEFLTCGRQHLGDYRLRGQLLLFESYWLDNPKELTELKETKDGIEVDFFSMIAVAGQVVTGGADGHLYLWENRRMINKQNAHPDSAIYTLHVGPGQNIFASGGADGRVILWILGKNNIIDKHHEYSLNEERRTKTLPLLFEVQSVCIGSSYILAGTRSGSIYELVRPDLVEQTKESNKSPVTLRQANFSDDVPVEVQFSPSAEFLYLVTRFGRFLVYSTADLALVNQVNFFQDRRNVVKSMTVCKRMEQMLVVTERDLRIVRFDRNEVGGNLFLQEFYESVVRDVKFSPNEKYVALLESSSKQKNARIQLYELGEGSLALLQTFEEGLPTNTEEIDFSSDSFHLMYRYQEERVIIDLSTMAKAASVEFEPEWCSSGHTAFQTFKDIFLHFREDFRVLALHRLDHENLIVADQAGLIRIFSNSGTQLRVYADHCTMVSKLVVSTDLQLVASISEHDRGLVLWRVVQH